MSKSAQKETKTLDLAKLKTLRELTGVSFALCKKALEETGNNLEESKKLLSQWAGKKIEEKSSRSTSAGGIFAYVHHNAKIAAMVELQSETDFVSGNQEFKKLGQELAMQAASIPAENVEAFTAQEYIRDPKKKIGDLIKDAVLKFGENIKIARFSRWQLGA